MDHEESAESPGIKRELADSEEEAECSESKKHSPEKAPTPDLMKLIEDLEAASDITLHITGNLVVSRRNNSLARLTKFITNNCPVDVPEKVKDLQDHLVDQLGKCKEKTLALTLKLLTAMLKNPSFRENLVKKDSVFVKAVLGLLAEEQTWVFFCARECGFTMTQVWSPEVLLPQLTGMLNEKYPINKGVVDILAHFVKHSGRDLVLSVLGLFLPQVIRAYEDNCIRFRRYVMFLFSYLYELLGRQELEPYVSGLVSWKRALLFGFSECNIAMKNKPDVKLESDLTAEASGSQVSSKVKSEPDYSVKSLEIESFSVSDPLGDGPQKSEPDYSVKSHETDCFSVSDPLGDGPQKSEPDYSVKSHETDCFSVSDPFGESPQKSELDCTEENAWGSCKDEQFRPGCSNVDLKPEGYEYSTLETNVGRSDVATQTSEDEDNVVLSEECVDNDNV